MTIYEEAPEGSTDAAASSSGAAHPVAGLPSEHPSTSYWLQDPSQALFGHRTTPDLPAEVDVVVVGSGITGSFAADALLEDVSDASGSEANKAPKVLLLEAREACFGATGRNGGHCQPMIYSSAYDVSDFELATFHFLDRFVAEHNVPCDWRTLAGVHAYLDEDLFALGQELVATLRTKRPDLADQVTVVKADAEEGAEGVTLDDLRLRGAAGAIVQRNAASVWPYKLVAWVLERLVQKHAASGAFNLQTNTPVLSVTRDASSWVVDTPRGQVRARTVLLATNGYSSHLLPRSLADLIVPVRAQVAALVPPSSDTKVKTSQTVENAPAGVTSSSTSSSSSSANGASQSSVTVTETKDGQTTTTTTKTTTSNAPADRLTHSYVFIGYDDGQARGGDRDEYLVQRPFTEGSSRNRIQQATASAQSSGGNAQASAFSSSSSSSSSSPSGGHFIWGGGRQRAAGGAVGVWRDDEVEPPVAGYLRSHLAPVLHVGGDNNRGEPPAALEADYEWTGIMGFSRDANPWVGRVPSEESGGEGLYLAAGYSGHGMPSTSLCGRAVAGIIKKDLGWDASSSSSSSSDDNNDKVIVSLPFRDGGHAELPCSFLLTPERIRTARATSRPVAEADTRGFLAEFQHALAARRAEQ